MQTDLLFKALADVHRLRMLRMLHRAELSVAELVEASGLPQSTVSRHLKPLRECGLVASRREGTSVYYRPGPSWLDRGFTDWMKEALEHVAGAEADERAVNRVLAERRRESQAFFDRMAGRYATLAQPGGGWTAVALALAAGFRGRIVADLGAGEGDLTMALARYARKVIAVDQSANMLELLERRASEAGLTGVTAVQGDLEHLPLADQAVDVVFLSQALHHSAEPLLALREARRVLRVGGQLLVLDLLHHEEEWVKDRLADQWLGFDDEELSDWLGKTGFTEIQVDVIDGEGQALPVLLASAVAE